MILQNRYNQKQNVDKNYNLMQYIKNCCFADNLMTPSFHKMLIDVFNQRLLKYISKGNFIIAEPKLEEFLLSCGEKNCFPAGVCMDEKNRATKK